MFNSLSRPYTSISFLINRSVEEYRTDLLENKDNNKITEIRTILQRESQNS